MKTGKIIIFILILLFSIYKIIDNKNINLRENVYIVSESEVNNKETVSNDVVEVDKVAEMLQFMFGDECACNYGGIDEWLPWTCKYAETECPEPKEKFACWKESVKAFMKRMNSV